MPKQTTKTASTKTTAKTSKPKSYTPAKRRHARGITLAWLSIPVGVVVWDLLWNYGFMASIVSYGIAYVAIKLYQMGAGAPPDRSAAKTLLAIIAIGVVLSFMSGMAMDAHLSYAEDTPATALQAYTSSDFWSFFLGNLAYADIWGSYFVDILIAVAFAFLGCFGIVRDLLQPQAQTNSKKAA